MNAHIHLMAGGRCVLCTAEFPLKYPAGHDRHGADCMSHWAELRRDVMTPETVEMNHRLHMASLTGEVDPTDEEERCSDCGARLSDDEGEGYDGRCGTCADRADAEREWVEASGHPSYWRNGGER